MLTSPQVTHTGHQCLIFWYHGDDEQGYVTVSSVTNSNQRNVLSEFSLAGTQPTLSCGASRWTLRMINVPKMEAYRVINDVHSFLIFSM